MTKEKYSRLLKSRHSIRVLVLVGLGLLVVVMLESIVVVRQNWKLRNLLAQRQLIQEIPRLERSVRLQGHGLKGASADRPLRLQGIGVSENVSYAVINDSVFRPGDQVESFVLEAIHADQVILQNEKDGRQVILLLYEEKDLSAGVVIGLPDTLPSADSLR